MTPPVKAWLLFAAIFFALGFGLWHIGGDGYSPFLRWLGCIIGACGAIALGFALDEYERPT